MGSKEAQLCRVMEVKWLEMEWRRESFRNVKWFKSEYCLQICGYQEVTRRLAA